MTRAALLLPLLLVGCGDLAPDRIADVFFPRPLVDDPAAPPPDLTPVADQDKFAQVAWEALGQLGTPPLIQWHREGCNDGDPDSYLDPKGECVWGHFIPGEPFVHLAVRPVRAWQSALAHEFVHFIDWRDRRFIDQGHAGPAFQPGGAVDSTRLAMMLAGW